MTINSAQLTEIVIEVAAERFGDKSFKRRSLMLVVEEVLKSRSFWTKDDDADSGSVGQKSKGLANIDYRISDLASRGDLHSERRDVWRLAPKQLARILNALRDKSIQELAIPLLKSSRVIVTDVSRTPSGTLKHVDGTTLVGEPVRIMVLDCFPHGETPEKAGVKFADAEFKENHLGALKERIARDEVSGISHYLVVQVDKEQIVRAILIPIQQVTNIWVQQEGISVKHAIMGSGCVLWLSYPIEPKLAEVVWGALGVVDLLAAPNAEAETGSLSLPGEDLLDIDFNSAMVKEGGRRWKQHFVRERKRSIVEAKKRDVLAKTGKLTCEACSFNFTEFYRPYAVNYCEVHHLRPLAELDESLVTTLDDLAILCSNCHRVIHLIEPMPSVEKLAGMFRQKRD